MSLKNNEEERGNEPFRKRAVPILRQCPAFEFVPDMSVNGEYSVMYDTECKARQSGQDYLICACLFSMDNKCPVSNEVWPELEFLKKKRKIWESKGDAMAEKVKEHMRNRD